MGEVVVTETDSLNFKIYDITKHNVNTQTADDIMKKEQEIEINTSLVPGDEQKLVDEAAAAVINSSPNPELWFNPVSASTRSNNTELIAKAAGFSQSEVTPPSFDSLSLSEVVSNQSNNGGGVSLDITPPSMSSLSLSDVSPPPVYSVPMDIVPVEGVQVIHTSESSTMTDPTPGIEQIYNTSSADPSPLEEKMKAITTTTTTIIMVDSTTMTDDVAPLELVLPSLSTTQTNNENPPTTTTRTDNNKTVLTIQINSSDKWKEVESFGSPPIDIIEHKDSYHIYAEVPQLNLKDISIDLSNNLFTLTGDKGDPQIPHRKRGRTEGSLVKQEINRGRFKRVLEMPDDADMEDVNVSFEEGLLQCKIRKIEQSKRTGKQKEKIEEDERDQIIEGEVLREVSQENHTEKEVVAVLEQEGEEGGVAGEDTNTTEGEGTENDNTGQRKNPQTKFGKKMKRASSCMMQ